MAEIFEIIMVVSFGFSWPMNIIRSVKSKTAKGKSLWFMLIILFGYVAGIVSKLVNPEYLNNIAHKWYVLFFYVLNFFMVLADTILYFRNRRLDKMREQEETKKAMEAPAEEAPEEPADQA